MEPGTVCGLLLCLWLSVLCPQARSAEDFAAWLRRIESVQAGRDLRLPLRQLVLSAAAEDRVEDALAGLENYLQRELAGRRSLAGLTTRQLESYVLAAELSHLLREYWLGRNPRIPPPRLAEWLLASPERVETLVNTLTRWDNWAEACRILELLHDHDPVARDRYFDLILALAVVWDQPRPPLHGQQGALSFSPDLAARYDYFKELYGSRRARLPYGRLSVVALRFVVDTPVPVEELAWARDQVRGTPSRWGDKFYEIEYDDDRLRRLAYVWDRSGDYTLRAIRQHGGICVDQAYYAVMTARAHGIPAMIFTGVGRRGPHAWIGHMLGEDRWEMDVGRYEYDEYMIGQTVDPQTNRPMSDHDIALSCSRAFRTRRGDLAYRYLSLARELLRMREYDLALQSAERAVRIIPILEPAWEIAEEALRRSGRERDLLAVLERQAAAFERYPDKLFEIASRRAEFFERRGELSAAERIFADLAPRIGIRRHDLGERVMREQVRLLARQQRLAEARKVMEAYITRNRDGGAQLLPVLADYVQLAGGWGQSAEAASFVSRLVGRMRGLAPDLMASFVGLEIQAAELAGDERAVERARRRWRRLR